MFVSGATNLGWELAIEDTESGEVWTGSNPFGQRSPAITDIEAFATCPQLAHRRLRLSNPGLDRLRSSASMISWGTLTKRASTFTAKGR